MLGKVKIADKASFIKISIQDIYSLTLKSSFNLKCLQALSEFESRILKIRTSRHLLTYVIFVEDYHLKKGALTAMRLG